jgi:hypothetical protein
MLIIIWAIGFFALGAGIIIHILLLIAVLATALAIIQGKRKFD